MFGCAVLTGVGAVINTAKVPAGSSVAVIGLGGVGLSALLGAVWWSARGASLQSTSPTTSSGSRASSVRPTRSTRAAPSAIEEIKAATGGGVEFAFEMAGSVRAMDLAYKITRRGGTTVTAGLPPPDHTFALPQVNLVAEERTVKGSYIGTCVPTRDLPRYIELYRRGKLPVDRLMSGRLKLEEINLGLRPVARRQGGAAGGGVLTWTPFEYMKALAELWGRGGKDFAAAQQDRFFDMLSGMAKAVGAEGAAKRCAGCLLRSSRAEPGESRRSTKLLVGRNRAVADPYP